MSKRRRTWVIRGILWSIVIVVFSGFTGCTLLIEAPIHFVAGWLFHATKSLPPLLGNWRAAILPLGCLALAVWLMHRFARWWQGAKGNPLSWKFSQTLQLTALLLLGCSAAIAMSGVIHQFVWLLKGPLTEDRGRRIVQTVAMNNARQLMLALLEFQDSKGRHPNSFQELVRELDLPLRLTMLEIQNGGVPEPFILLHPGGTRVPNADDPVIVSPIFDDGSRVVVGFGDLSVRSFPAGKWKEILQARHEAALTPNE